MKRRWVLDMSRVDVQFYMDKYNLHEVLPERLYPHLSLHTVEKGEQLCRQGEQAKALYIVVKGKAKVFTTSMEGKTLVLSFQTPIELIGDIEYIQNIDIINTVEAVSSVTVIKIPYKFLRKHCEQYSPFLMFLLKVITDKFNAKSNFLKLNVLYPVEVRLASYLLSHSFDEEHSLVTGMHSTKNLKDTANLIGTSYRHLNRVIQQFSELGLVERKDKWIQIKDWEGLREMAGSSLYE